MGEGGEGEGEEEGRGREGNGKEGGRGGSDAYSVSQLLFWSELTVRVYRNSQTKSMVRRYIQCLLDPALQMISTFALACS